MWNDTERQDPQTTWSVRVGVHLPVFDGLTTRAQVHQAEALRRQGSLGIEALDSDIVVQVQQAYLSYQEARAVLAAQEEAVTQVDEALRIATIHGARASYEEHVKGSIAAGKLADFVMLERDPHEVDPDDIKNIAIVRTVVGGRTVYPATT